MNENRSFDFFCRWCGHEVKRVESDPNAWRHARTKGLRSCENRLLVQDIDPAMSDVLMLPRGSLALLDKHPARHEVAAVKFLRDEVKAHIRVAVLVFRLCENRTEEALSWLLDHGYERTQGGEQ